jgi:hypothetical protein
VRENAVGIDTIALKEKVRMNWPIICFPKKKIKKA